VKKLTDEEAIREAQLAESLAKKAERQAKKAERLEVKRQHKAAVVNASSMAETYLAELRAGKTVSAIAREYGVSRQAVSQMTTGHRGAILRKREHDKRRRPPSRRGPDRCSACGEEGHHCDNVDFHPENAG
jgi:hypothetical protein